MGDRDVFELAFLFFILFFVLKIGRVFVLDVKWLGLAENLVLSCEFEAIVDFIFVFSRANEL